MTFQTEPGNGRGEQERLSGSGRPTWISERQVNRRNQGGQIHEGASAVTAHVGTEIGAGQDENKERGTGHSVWGKRGI